MRGLPIDQLTLSDIDRLIVDGVPEGARIEFKEDIPVSDEEQRAQLKRDPESRPLDRSWTQSKALMKFGRDALAEEIVAFANAAGGTLILGMKESKDAPPRAAGINPLPNVAGLERRLRDALIDCIEPRLPYLAVRGLPIGADGAGVVLIETAPSSIGPHWVKTSRKAAIRREDRCDPLSMPEIHDMVIRLARHGDSARARAEIERAAFAKKFERRVGSAKPSNWMGEGAEAVRIWIEKTGFSALGAQVLLTPHFDIGIPRLEKADGLLPNSNAIQIEGPPARSTHWIEIYGGMLGSQRKILGGVELEQSGGFDKSVRIQRDGRVSVRFSTMRENGRMICNAELIVTAVGFAAGIFDRLRSVSGYPTAPADIVLDIHSRGSVYVAGFEGIGRPEVHGQLGDHTEFPRYTLGPTDDLSTPLAGGRRRLHERWRGIGKRPAQGAVGRSAPLTRGWVQEPDFLFADVAGRS